MNKEIDRTPALGLWRYAKDFMNTAKTVHENNVYKVSDTVLYYLYCHAIELSLKAFLRTQGLKVDDIKKFGHNLEKILFEAKNRDTNNILSLTHKNEATIRVLNPYYQEKELEYIVIGYKQFPEMKFVRDCAESLVSNTKNISAKHTSTKS